jgi:hypothetical protein
MHPLAEFLDEGIPAHRRSFAHAAGLRSADAGIGCIHWLLLWAEGGSGGVPAA